LAYSPTDPSFGEADLLACNAHLEDWKALAAVEPRMTELIASV
jgi:hypothetical protein